MPNDDMREIARESAALTSSSPLREDDVPRRGTVTDPFVLDESTSSSDGRTCGDEDVPSRFIRACMTSGEALASAGRYAFMATTDAPKPTLAQMANNATKIHSGDEDDNGRKSMAEKEPMAAKVSRSGFRHVAGGRQGKLV